ncbi:MAG: class I SAM-dependent methyltransferase [Ginsengibacter sp.]
MIKEPDQLFKLIGQTDIYLLDQIMKGRYQSDEKILDAGCGSGRNMKWFLQNDFDIYGIDTSEAAIMQLQKLNTKLASKQLQVAALEKIPFDNNFFDHVICSAVLHFANNVIHFNEMFSELLRVLKSGGTLFIRMASDIGIEKQVELLSDGNYKIPDGSMRFLLTKPLLEEIKSEFQFSFLEPLKTVNVNDIRCMSTLMLQK